jgi:hypothetical protein
MAYPYDTFSGGPVALAGRTSGTFLWAGYSFGAGSQLVDDDGHFRPSGAFDFCYHRLSAGSWNDSNNYGSTDYSLRVPVYIPASSFRATSGEAHVAILGRYVASNDTCYWVDVSCECEVAASQNTWTLKYTLYRQDAYTGAGRGDWPNPGAVELGSWTDYSATLDSPDTPGNFYRVVVLSMYGGVIQVAVQPMSNEDSYGAYTDDLTVRIQAFDETYNGESGTDKECCAGLGGKESNWETYPGYTGAGSVVDAFAGTVPYPTPGVMPSDSLTGSGTLWAHQPDDPLFQYDYYTSGAFALNGSGQAVISGSWDKSNLERKAEPASSPNYGSTDYKAVADIIIPASTFRSSSQTANLQVFGRAVTYNDTCYWVDVKCEVVYSGGGPQNTWTLTYTLYRQDNGGSPWNDWPNDQSVSLGSWVAYSNALTSPDVPGDFTAEVVLEMIGSAIKVYVDGTERISAVDATYDGRANAVYRSALAAIGGKTSSWLSSEYPMFDSFLIGESSGIDVDLPIMELAARQDYGEATLPLLDVAADAPGVDATLPVPVVMGDAPGVDATLPMLSIVTGSDGIDVGLPMFEVLAGQNTALDNWLPIFEVEGWAQPEQRFDLDVSLPRLSVAGVGKTGRVGTGTLELPMFGVAAELGGAAELTLPAPEVSATNLNGRIGAANISLGLFAIAGIIENPPIITGDLALPAPRASAAAGTGNTGSLDIALRAFALAAEGLTGRVGTAEIELPVFGVEVSGYPAYIGTASLELPMFTAEISGHGAVAESYRAYSMNVRTAGMTNSFANFRGQVLAAGAGGIFALTGDADSGAIIEAAARGGRMDFGTDHLKRVKDVYVLYRSDGPLQLNVLLEETEEPYKYALEHRDKPGLRPHRVRLGRALKSAYWQFEIVNIDGVDFQVDGIDFSEVAKLKRRLG